MLGRRISAAQLCAVVGLRNGYTRIGGGGVPRCIPSASTVLAHAEDLCRQISCGWLDRFEAGVTGRKGKEAVLSPGGRKRSSTSPQLPSPHGCAPSSPPRAAASCGLQACRACGSAGAGGGGSIRGWLVAGTGGGAPAHNCRQRASSRRLPRLPPNCTHALRMSADQSTQQTEHIDRAHTPGVELADVAVGEAVLGQQGQRGSVVCGALPGKAWQTGGGNGWLLHQAACEEPGEAAADSSLRSMRHATAEERRQHSNGPIAVVARAAGAANKLPGSTAAHRR